MPEIEGKKSKLDNESKIPENLNISRLSNKLRAVSSHGDPSTVSLLKQLKDYVKFFGFDFQTLDAHAIRVFLIARELESFVQNCAIPVATISSEQGTGDFLHKETATEVEKTISKKEEVVSQTPDNSLDYVPIKSAYDLPYVPFTEFLMEEALPNLFWKRVVNREILKQERREVRDIPVNSIEKYPKSEVVEEKGKDPKPIIDAALLVDVSSSIFKDDGRAEFIKGLALAFIRQVFEQKSALHFFSFGRYVSPETIAVTEEQYQKLASKILNLAIIPGNGIQEALETGVLSIRTQSSTVTKDIVLITDGGSELTNNPLSGIRLHTFVIRGSEDRVPHEYLELRAKMIELGMKFQGNPSVPDGRAKLQRWSSLYKEINTKDFPKMITPMPEEVMALKVDILSLEEELDKVQSLDNLLALEEKFDSIENLLKSLELPPLGGGNSNTKAVSLTFDNFKNRLAEKSEEIRSKDEEEFFENLPETLKKSTKAPLLDKKGNAARQKGGGKIAEQGKGHTLAGDRSSPGSKNDPGFSNDAEELKAASPPIPREKFYKRNFWWILIQFIKRLGDRNAGDFNSELDREEELKDKKKY